MNKTKKNDPWKDIKPISKWAVDEDGKIVRSSVPLPKGSGKSEFIPQPYMSQPKYSKHFDEIHNNRKEKSARVKGNKVRMVCPRQQIVQHAPVQVILKGADPKTKEIVSIKVKLNKDKRIFHTRPYLG